MKIAALKKGEDFLRFLAITIHSCTKGVHTVGHKRHDPCFHTFLMEAGIMTFMANCVFHTREYF